jgi:excisionase family DNA binding protein
MWDLGPRLTNRRLHSVHYMQTLQERHEKAGLLTAEQVEFLLEVDKSTIYRMAADGRLPAIKVGRQWRFPAAPIHELLSSADGRTVPTATTATPARAATVPLAGVSAETAAAGVAATVAARFAAPPASTVMQPIVDLAADLLGVMMVVTDMDGRPITEVANPCPWFAERLDDPDVLASCTAEWRTLADDLDFEPRLRTGVHGFECARALIRDGSHLVGMVLAGGIAPEGIDATDLYHLNASARQSLLAALPRVAATLSQVTLEPTDSRSS